MLHVRCAPLIDRLWRGASHSLRRRAGSGLPGLSHSGRKSVIAIPKCHPTAGAVCFVLATSCASDKKFQKFPLVHLYAIIYALKCWRLIEFKYQICSGKHIIIRRLFGFTIAVFEFGGSRQYNKQRLTGRYLAVIWQYMHKLWQLIKIEACISTAPTAMLPHMITCTIYLSTRATSAPNGIWIKIDWESLHKSACLPHAIKYAPQQQR